VAAVRVSVGIGVAYALLASSGASRLRRCLAPPRTHAARRLIQEAKLRHRFAAVSEAARRQSARTT
jgi:hypothetical protein